MRINLFPDAVGEPRVYSFTINYSARKTPGARPWYGAFFLYWPGNHASIGWKLGARRLAAHLRLDDTGDEHLTLHLAFPFLGAFWLSLSRCSRLLQLLGLTWAQVREKPSRDWLRSIGFTFRHGTFWIDPWINPDEYDKGRRHTLTINLADLLFGRPRVKVTTLACHGAVVQLPEGGYPATVRLYTATYKRPLAFRPWRVVPRFDIEVEDGIPIPGKGDNSWDMEDDAVYEVSGAGDSVETAVAAIRAAIMQSRERYGGQDWTPDDGWSA